MAVAQTARNLASGYYAFVVAHSVAVNPHSINSLPPPKELGQDPTGNLPRKDGTFHTLNLRYYLDLLRENRDLQTQVLRTWAISAMLALGDELRAHRYFDHAPILELVYHLRNGMAHGNKFAIDERGRERLHKYPAHNRDAAVKGDLKTVYEITPDLTGSILFDFMGPGDVIDVLQSVEIHLSR